MSFSYVLRRRVMFIILGGLLTLLFVLALTLWLIVNRRLPDCESDSMIITHEAARLVVSRGVWKVQNRFLHATGNYNGLISYYGLDHKLLSREPVDVSFELKYGFTGSVLRSETTSLSYNLGNRADDESIARYTSAGLSLGHINYGWIYRLQNKKYVLGNNFNPTIICMK